MPDRLSLKWIDGNDVISSGNVSSSLYNQDVSPTFNVDDPTFWQPLSVLSGLASGYCERRAVLNSEFIISSGLSANWYTSGQSGVAIREAITENCMHNLALGSSGDDNLFRAPADAYLHPIGSVATSNYMTAMDSALTALVSSGGYVDANGSSYASTGRTAFVGLASSAVSAASSAGSALTAPIVSNSVGVASGMMQPMYPALPAEWAKQRKWMLEDLKNTIAPGPGSIRAAARQVAYQLEDMNGLETATTLHGFVSSALSETVTLTNSSGYRAKSFIRVLHSGGIYKYESATAEFAYGVGAEWPAAITVAAAAPVSCYITTINLMDDEGYWFTPYDTYTNTDIKTFNSGSYTMLATANTYSMGGALVKNGAVVSFGCAVGAEDVTMWSLDIESGGTAYVDLESGGTGLITSIGFCNVHSGGSLYFKQNGLIISAPSNNGTYAWPAGGMYMNGRDYRHTIAYYGNYTYVNAGNVSTVPNTFGIVIGTTGAAATVSLTYTGAVGACEVRSGCRAVLKNSNTNVAAIAVNEGAALSISSGAVGFCYVHNGAVVDLYDRCSDAEIHSGGTMVLHSTCSVDHLSFEEGATIIISGATAANGTLINARESAMINNVSASLFYPFQLSQATRTQQGSWTIFSSNTITSETTSRLRFFGSASGTNIATIRNSVSSTIANMRDLSDYTEAAYGSSVIIDGGTYTGYSVFSLLPRYVATYGFEIPAMYAQEVVQSGTITSHYTDFRVRQFPTDAEVSSAFPS